MSEKFLPQGWKVGRLGDRTLARTVSGGTPNRSVPEYFNGNVPWVKSGELNDNYIFDTEEKITDLGMKSSSAKIFPKGTLLIAMYGATAGKTGILALDAATNQAVCAIFPINDSFDSNFLQYYLIHIREEILCSRSGGAQPNISQRVIGSLEIILPPSPEQRAIAHSLRAVQAAWEARLHESALERERKAALMEHLFRYGTKGEATKQTEIGEMPESWEVASLMDIASSIIVPTRDKPKEFGGPYPWITLPELKNDFLFISSSAYSLTKESADSVKNRLMPKDTVLLSCAGSLGKSVVLGVPAYANQQFYGFVCRQDRVIPAYLCYKLKSFTEGYFKRIAGVTTLPFFSKGVALSIAIPLPSLNEQQEITNILLACDSKISAIDHEARLHDELFLAMLEELMSGRLSTAGLVESSLEINK